jgi:uridine kinase
MVNQQVDKLQNGSIVLTVNTESHDVHDIEKRVYEVLTPIRKRIEALLANRSIAIAIGGGSAVGKTAFFTPALANNFGSVRVISEDDYCVGNSISSKKHGSPNLHVPEDYDPELLAEHISELKKGNSVEKPVYSYKIRERIGKTRIDTAKLLIVEGEFLLHPPLSNQFDIKVFIQTDDHSRFMRRVIRPRRNPNQTDLERILEYFNLSFPFYHSHIAPTATHADFVINNHYLPAEGKERISDANREVLFAGSNLSGIFSPDTAESVEHQFVRSYFKHPFSKKEEMLHMTEYETGDTFLQYSPGITSSEDNGVTLPWIKFSLERERLDLRNVGYVKYAEIRGEEISLKNNDVHKKLVKLADDREVVQLSQVNANNNSSDFNKAIQEVESSILQPSKILKPFDIWALES